MGDDAVGPIRGVLFDAGNTLLWIDHARIAETIRAAGLDANTERVAAAEMRARPLLDPHLGKAPKRETPEVFHRYVDHLLDGLGTPAEPARRRPIHDALQAVWPSLWVVKPDDVEPTLVTLAARGYRLGCVSNSNGSVEDSLVAAGLDPYLECVVDSGLEGVEKPDPRLFRIAAERLDLPPSALAYIGDFHAIDVVGARAAGMTAFLMDPIGAWEGHSDAIRVRRLGDLLHFLPDRSGRDG